MEYLRSSLEGFLISKIPHHEDEGLGSKLLTNLQHYGVGVGVVLPTVDASVYPAGAVVASDKAPSLLTQT